MNQVIPATEPDHEFTPRDAIENPESSQHKASEHQPSTDTSWSSQRPTRARKRPAYLKDYVTSKTKGEEEVATPGC